MTSSDPADGGPERRTGERRRYNRRAPLTEAGPPYYEAFNRIATAMEAMQQSVEHLVESLEHQQPSTGSSRLPDPPPRPRAG